ncbi:hypothetical protein F7D08_0181 [Bifidobacterium cebidarum]|uniref:Uncharacterized protein n=1 Tax=Bifidobacterium cebidarum TaxID=2650773 RepID=A0A6I1GII4_9BIFI|nr:hypothetical protein F7D08_0181 [Bifidobacterium cebidarum]
MPGIAAAHILRAEYVAGSSHAFTGRFVPFIVKILSVNPNNRNENRCRRYRTRYESDSETYKTCKCHQFPRLPSARARPAARSAALRTSWNNAALYATSSGSKRNP